jgi:cold shock protein
MLACILQSTCAVPPTLDRSVWPTHLQPEEGQPDGSRNGQVLQRGKGYAFIAPDEGGRDLFVHYSAITGTGLRSLEAGQKVEYDVKQGTRGPEATNVRAI